MKTFTPIQHKRRAAALLAALGLVTAGLMPGSTAAVAQAPAPPACPPVFPVSGVQPGMTGVGYTVSTGMEPEPFDVEILGVLDDGIAPGKDMIVVEVDSPAIDRVKGIWSGMSGSPVYIDGKLVGAVAYGFSLGPSKIGGLTPAEEMVKVLEYTGEGGDDDSVKTNSLPLKVKVTKRERKAIARQSDSVTAGQVGDFERLKLPFAVSGVSGARMKMLREAAEREKLPIIPYAASAASTAAPPADAGIDPGDSFAASLSYGDVTDAAVGTATAVCDGKVLAFGHPFLFEGRTVMGASPADTITIIDDPTLTPFKMANVLGPTGEVDQDRLAAIRADLSELPQFIPITSSVTATNNNRTREGKTEAVLSEAVPFLAFLHSLVNIDVTYDEIGEGSAELTWTVTGTTEAGQQWSLSRSNMFASDFDIAIESLFELQDQLFALSFNEFEDVEFTGVNVQATVHEEVRQYTISDVNAARNKGRFVESNKLKVRRGDTVRLRVVLEPFDATENKVVTLKVKVPKKAKKKTNLLVRGAEFSGGFFCFFESDCSDQYGNKIESLDDLIKALEESPKNNEVRALIYKKRCCTIASADSETLDKVVTGRKRIKLTVTK